MFEDDLKNMSEEEQEVALTFMEQYLEEVAIGNGEDWED